jgi:hypothetical protein
MVAGKAAEEASLLDILVDGFESNEVLGGFHCRDLPLLSEALAVEKFEALVAEAKRWKGEPVLETRTDRREAAWADLTIRQAGRGIRLLIKTPRFDAWWHAPATWADDPMGPLRVWMHSAETSLD